MIDFSLSLFFQHKEMMVSYSTYLPAVRSQRVLAVCFQVWYGPIQSTVLSLQWTTTHRLTAEGEAFSSEPVSKIIEVVSENIFIISLINTRYFSQEVISKKNGYVKCNFVKFSSFFFDVCVWVYVYIHVYIYKCVCVCLCVSNIID